jgi:hypothetical protein
MAASQLNCRPSEEMQAELIDAKGVERKSSRKLQGERFIRTKTEVDTVAVRDVSQGYRRSCLGPKDLGLT